MLMLQIQIFMVYLALTRIQCTPIETGIKCTTDSRSSSAGLSSEYAADTFEEAQKFPILLDKEPSTKIDSTPWWGDQTRSIGEQALVAQLKQSIELTREKTYEGTYTYPSYRRKKRASSPVIDQITSVCSPQNSLINNAGTHRICAVCDVVTEFDVDRLPRFANEVICDPEAEIGGKQDAFGGEGTCIQKTVTITILKDNLNGTYSEESYDLGTGCGFTLYPGSVLLLL